MCICVCVGYEMVSLLWEGLVMVGFGIRFWRAILAISTYLCKQTNKQAISEF